MSDQTGLPDREQTSEYEEHSAVLPASRVDAFTLGNATGVIMPVTNFCRATHAQTGAVCELPNGHEQNHRGPFAHGIAQWPEATTRATCETNGHIWGHDKCCVFCGVSLFAEPLVEVGDTIVSKFGNLWTCEA